MTDFARYTPTAFKRGWRSLGMNRTVSVSDASITLDSVTYAAATLAILSDRFLFWNYIDGALRSTQWGLVVPSDYIAGTDIKVKLIWTNNIASGDVEWRVGFCKKTSNAFVGDSGTEFKTVIETTTSGAGEFDAQYTSILTFDGSTLSPNDSIAITVSRDSQAGNTLDTIAGSCYLNLVLFYHETENFDAALTDTDFKVMTPVINAPTNFDYHFDGWIPIADPGTFNGVVCAVSTDVTLVERWRGKRFNNGANNVLASVFHIPVNYKQGTDIMIHVHWYPAGATGGNVDFNLGYCKTNIDGQFGDDAVDTTYQQVIEAAPTVTEERKETMFTISGTDISPNELGCIILYRRGSGGSDTLAQNITITAIAIEIPKNKNNIETIT